MGDKTNKSASTELESSTIDLDSKDKSTSETSISDSNGTSAVITDNVVTHKQSETTTVSEGMNHMTENTTTTESTQDSTSDKHALRNVSAVYGNYEDYQLLPEAPWPPPIFVRRDISPQERYYIEHRWYSQWSFFDKKATENKNRYFRTQLIVGVGSVTVPVLVGINATGIAGTVLYFVTVFISLSVALSTAIESLYTFGDNWRSYRSAAENLHQEKSLYDVKAGRYMNNQQAFIRFVERCEEIIAQQNGRWVQSQEKAAEQTKEQAEDFLSDQYGNKLATSSVQHTRTTTVQESMSSSSIESNDSENESYPTANTDYIEAETTDTSSPTSYG